MSLLGWLGKEIPKVDPRSLSPTLKRGTTVTKENVAAPVTVAHDRIVLGVLGTRSNMRFEDVDTQLMAPILEAWGTPDEVLVPSDGDSSFAIQSWAQRREIPVCLVSADWKTQGRRAGLLRDARIQREATHIMLLQGPRSNAMTALGSRLARKGRPVVISERPGQGVRPVE
jgi:hypothetical protein